jgi:hypothetical protein
MSCTGFFFGLFPSGKNSYKKIINTASSGCSTDFIFWVSFHYLLIFLLRKFLEKHFNFFKNLLFHPQVHPRQAPKEQSTPWVLPYLKIKK